MAVATVLSGAALLALSLFEVPDPWPFYIMVALFFGWVIFDFVFRTVTKDSAPPGHAFDDEPLFETNLINANGLPMTSAGIDVGGHGPGSTET